MPSLEEAHFQRVSHAPSQVVGPHWISHAYQPQTPDSETPLLPNSFVPQSPSVVCVGGAAVGCQTCDQ